MPYITNADIQERLGSATYVQLTDDDGDGIADVGVVDEARIGAEGELDSYLAKRFQVPINLVAHPDLVGVLSSVALDLVEYRLRLRRPPVDKSVTDRRTRTTKWLQGVANGDVELPSSSSVAINVTKGVIAEVSGSERLLSRDELSDF